MKHVQLIHNTSAGEGKYGKAELIALLEERGYNCEYFSTKSFKKAGVRKGLDLLIVAGGDGTVRKAVKLILKTQLLDRPNRIAILPLGTANNIARSIGIQGDEAAIIQSWEKTKGKVYDVGRLINVRDERFFLESFGYGLFPFLIKKMESKNSIEKTGKKRKDMELEELLEIARSYPVFKCTIVIDGKDHSGKYLLVEIMNTPSLGPNLLLSPDAKVGDGYFDVVLVAEKQRESLINLITARINKKPYNHRLKRVRGKDIRIYCETQDVHADSKLLNPSKQLEVKIQIKNSLLTFL
jgi:diacylglycerol kinase (ATP)